MRRLAGRSRAERLARGYGGALASCLLLMAAGCGADDAQPFMSGAAGAKAASMTGSAVAGAGGADVDEEVFESVCESGRMTSISPRSVAEVVDILNAMPKPVTLPCFLERLARPLALQATLSIFSAQPAVGKRSPRIFIIADPLIASVAPDGVGRALLELGERRSETHSLKAELEFPITAELAPSDPYTQVRYDDTLTSCDFCHAEPSPVPELMSPYALISQAMRPFPRDRVTIDTLRAETEACDDASEHERCEMLHALFDGVPKPAEGEFPPTYKTFF